jgi:pimeloyl-ACP methyl ester carboxylesterase
VVQVPGDRVCRLEAKRAKAMSDLHVTSRSRPGPCDIDRGRQALRGAPVLLLHGFLATPRSLRALRHRLVRDGFRVFSVSLGGRFNTRRIDEQARLVRDEVERIYAREPHLPRLIVIGPSQGGLVASWWVKCFGGQRRVRTLVTLGTPHRGTRMAWLGILFAWLMPSLLQMLPGSGFIRRLREIGWPARVAVLSMYSRRDRVAPWPGALVDVRLSHARNVEVDAAHGDYLLKKRVYGAIVSELWRTAAAEARPVAAAATAASTAMAA